MFRYAAGWTLAGLLLATTAVAQSAEPVPAAGDDADATTHLEVRIPTTDPAVTLAGTLSKPAEGMGRALVVFLTGSGDHVRDGVISGTPMFAEMADALLDVGFSTLRVDDRGTGQSTGPTTTASTTADRITDMRTVVSWIAQGEAGATDALVLLGLSEGASVAAAVAARQPEVDAVVLLGAPARSGRTVWIDQQLAGVAQHLDRPASELTEIRDLLGDVVDRSVGGDDEAAIEEAGVALFEATGMDMDEARESGLLDGFVQRVSSPWFRHFLGYDPGDDYRRVTVPVLAVYGSLDRLTSPALNAQALRAAILDAGSPDFTLEILPDQDHFFLRADHLAPGEHRFGEMHVAPELLETLTSWLTARF